MLSNRARLLRGLRAIGSVLVIAAGTSACAPRLDSIQPNRGYPRQLLAVKGETAFAGVVWNVGNVNEKVLYNGLFGTQYFQIPADAQPGTYPVALRNDDGTSGSATVTVLPATAGFPAPRIEDIGLLSVAGAGPVDTLLTVSAANLDVDATVTVTETVGAAAPTAKTITDTVRWGALPVDYLQDHQPATFGYPIYHYTQLLSAVKSVSLASTLTVTVTNTDGQQASRTYSVPASLSNLDSDGDGLLDTWEDGSYIGPSGNAIPLAAIGTHKWRKDVLVEVDWIPAAEPDHGIFPRLRDAFAGGPVLNPDGSAGVNLIIDYGPGSLPSGPAQGGEALKDHDILAFGNFSPVNGKTVTNFFDYKSTHFDPDRLRIFHYAIFGRQDLKHASGRGETFGNDLYVTLLDPVYSFHNNIEGQTGAFMHELGHNLGLTHGDLFPPNAQSDEPFKPNLPSVMTYWYTFDGVDTDCDMKGDGVFTYSQGTLAPIVEATVDEHLGICDNKPVDMDRSGSLTVSVDINQDLDLLDVWDDYDQWGHLLFDFQASGSNWDGN
jgi:hypothetical protein